ncbi:unnamed protein product [Lactuca virosa]|uniref:Uncharacterized protein n=1 Tax=Lactuca virosa TaxID=75947 RepID=A0AAU9M6C8_9ASTR|nr:unnamed protein product [Lactuca virosa]
MTPPLAYLAIFLNTSPTSSHPTIYATTTATSSITPTLMSFTTKENDISTDLNSINVARSSEYKEIPNNVYGGFKADNFLSSSFDQHTHIFSISGFIKLINRSKSD